MKPLDTDFYDRPVLQVARELIGCTVVNGRTSGVIVETEAYHESEPACHAYIGLTPRTGTLFGEPGHAYVYRSYGIHALFNAVCEPQGVGAAVLIRALAPMEGVELMRSRRMAGRPARSDVRPLRERELSSGPGRLTQALAIGIEANGDCLVSGPVRILGRRGTEPQILAGPRIGISKAVELPWRFCLAGDENVSRPWPWSGEPRRPRARVGNPG